MADLLKFRSASWEEDISRSHDSPASFENLIPPNQMHPGAFDVPSRISDSLLGRRTLSEYVARDGFPIPHTNDREGYQANHDARYFLNGLVDYLRIRRTVKNCGVPIDSYLDFGCASGRVLRHFCAQSDVRDLWGCDINGRHIKWLNDFLPPRLKIIHNHCLPSLPIASRSMDVISAFSVFTHIDVFETAWLAEIHRILKPGGLVYLTVHNDATWEQLQTINASGTDDHLLNRLCDINPHTRRWLAKPLPEGRTDFRHTDVGPYRALVFHSNDYLVRTWGRFFQVVEIQPQSHGRYQAVFVGKKK